VVFKPVVDYLAKKEGVEIYLFTSPLARALYDGELSPSRIFQYATSDFNNAWKRPGFLLSLISQVRKIRPDVCLLAEDQGNVAHLLATLSGAPLRVGSMRPFLKWKYGINVNVQPGADCKHAIWAWKLLEAFCRETDEEPPLFPPVPDLTHLIQAAPKYDFLIHPGGSAEYKRWLPERFAELANRLASEYTVGWFSAGGKFPGILTKNIHCLDTPDLADMVSLLAVSRIFVGNNSGPMNIAQALGIPSVIFCGPSPRSWDPVWYPERMRLLRDESLGCICCDPLDGPLNRCINLENPMACMKAWSVDEVERECRQWFEHSLSFPRCDGN